ncbi:MAG: hypothetical protein ACXWYE_05690 [Actinomycetota bacterium]
MLRRFALLVLVTAVAGCADPAPAGQDASSAPALAVIECEADGSTTIGTPEVQAQPDGVHVRVVSHLDEPASINGWGFDVVTGTSRWTFGSRPGVVETACWPYSGHGKEEPATQPIEILDPSGLFVDGELDCEGMWSSSVSDYASEPDADAPPIPLDEARSMVRGLLPGDQVRYAGYPQEPDQGVIVVRDGRVIASLRFARFGGRWSSPGGSICVDDEIRVAEG